jgi:circadian clock protein KaiB
VTSSVGTRLTLYLASDAPNSVAALANLKTVLAQHPDHEVVLEIVDVVAEPDRGLRDGVLMTPMLVRNTPLPERRILGNLHNARLLVSVLGFVASDA